MLAKSFRLSDRSDFERLKRSNRVISTPFFKVKYGENGLSYSRFAVVVSAKVSKKATDRNQLRRRLIEILRAQAPDVQKGVDMVVMVYKKALDADFAELERAIIKGLKGKKLLS